MGLQDVSARQTLPDHATRKGDGLLIVALAGGATVPEAAARARVSVRTVQRRLDDPAFRQHVSEARGAMIARAVGQLADATTEAARTLRELLDAEAETVKLGAARAILEHAVKLRESAELETRIAALEERIAQGNRRGA